MWTAGLWTDDMARALIIDLDDTLYEERRYVLSGFRAVAAEISRRFPQVDAGRVFSDMLAELDAHGRGQVFDRALANLRLGADPQLIGALVQAYRSHRPEIALWPGVADALADLARGHKLAVVTDGSPLMQRRKVEALAVEPLVDEVLYCWEHGSPKPDPACYVEALRRLGARPEETVVIGDNPGHDMAAAAVIGCRSIRVLTGRYASLGDAGFPPDATAPSFLGVAAILQDGWFGAAA
jgi:putative hydrolase of the HAD superfamily